MVYALGSLNLPWPIPEGQGDFNGISLGLSAMGGQYNLEANANYHMVGADLGFEYQGIHFSGEYMYSFTHLFSPLEATPSSTTLKSPTELARDFEVHQGYYLQASFPILRHPRWGKRLSGVLVYNRMFRRGPLLDLLTNQTVNGVTFPSVAAFNTDAPRITRTITKYTGAVNYQLSEYFTGKLDYSYWVMSRSSTLTGVRDIYQLALSLVLSF